MQGVSGAFPDTFGEDMQVSHPTFIDEMWAAFRAAP
jgi:hypothetical protein